MFDTSVEEAEHAAWLESADERDAELIGVLSEACPDTPEDPTIPAELASMEPGIVLAAVLSGIDIDALSGHDRVVVMAARQRMASHYQAQVYAAMVSVAGAVEDTLGEEDDPALVEDACSSEIRAALRLTRRAADSELSIARGFQTRLPAVWEAFASGRFDRRRANLILHRTDHLSVALAREVALRALERAPELTTGQLTALLRRLCVEADPDDAKRRYESVVEERRVVLEASVDGTAHLYLMDLPPERAVRIRRRIDAAAQGLRTKDETRTMDQLRADVAMDILDPDGEQAGTARRGAIVMTVDLATLAGLAQSAGDLGGYGPVIADIARQVADASKGDEWRFAVTDSHGPPLHAGMTRRRPTAVDQRMVETLYPTCVFPGCRIPASQCDLDHTTLWADGGHTSPHNLAPLCRHDHRVRHRAGWGYRRTEDGDHEWVSPLGHRYVSTARSP